MNKLTFTLVTACLFGANTIGVANAEENEIKAYCASMGDGLSEEDAQYAIQQCIEEQSMYMDAQVYEEPAGEDCYEKADEAVNQNPALDYDQVVQECLDQHM